MRRYTVWTILFAFSLHFLGCAGGSRVLTQEDLENPEPAREYRVITSSGESVTFISLHLEGSHLKGTSRVQLAQTVEDGDGSRTVMSNRYEERQIPWSNVTRVEADYGKGDRRGGVLLTAVSVAAGVGAFLLLTLGGDGSSEDSGGKRF